MHLVAAADWQDVVIAALTLAGVIFNGFVALAIARHVRPRSGGRLGDYVEDAAQTSRANNLLLRKLNGHGLESSGDSAEETA